MGKVAFVFPGQASQYPGMGKELAEKYAVARAVFDTVLGGGLQTVRQMLDEGAIGQAVGFSGFMGSGGPELQRGESRHPKPSPPPPAWHRRPRAAARESTLE